jgi:putative ABC transport system ATP-binding protein
MVEATTPDARALLRLESVGRSYGDGAHRIDALRDVDLEIHTGEFTVILGPSGSGKSTLLNLIGGMDTASSGVIRIRDQDLTAYDEAARTDYRRASVGFVFQFYNLVSNLTALENVAIAAGLVKSRRDAMRSARSALRGVGLAHRLDNFPHQLSGGEMQRVAIARALAKSPAMLLCDEPTGALDSATGADVMALLRASAKPDTAVVVVTHNSSLADHADHLIRLADGRVVETARSSDGAFA